MSARKAKKRAKAKSVEWTAESLRDFFSVNRPKWDRELEREQVKTLMAVIGDFDPKSQHIIAGKAGRLGLL